jgi:hypothetical protein
LAVVVVDLILHLQTQVVQVVGLSTVVVDQHLEHQAKEMLVGQDITAETQVEYLVLAAAAVLTQ